MNKRKLILISGIPGTGKTTTGNFLTNKYGFIHIDMEENHNTSKIMENQDKFIHDNFDGNSNIVVTWGFSPDQETINTVKRLEKYGFRIFWFDGNRDSARKATMQRKDFDEQVLNTQMDSLSNWNIPEKINAKIIDVFDQSGRFRGLEDVAKEIGAI